MAATIKVPTELASDFAGFISQERLPLELASTGDAMLAVELTTERCESNCNLLRSGGWISCEEARQLAIKLHITKAEIGKLLDHLDVKVRRCELGCF